MPVLSSAFIGLVAGAAILFWLTRGTRFGAAVLFASGVAFFAWAPAHEPARAEAYAPLAAFLVCTAVTVWSTRGLVKLPIPERGRRLWLPIGFLALLLTAAKAADAPWSAATPFHFAIPLGLSYYVLRSIAALVETSRGTLREPSALDMAGFLGFAPILAVGPIERASSFFTQWRARVASREAYALACQGLARIVEGLFKLWILCDFVKPYAKPFLDPSAPASPVADGAHPWLALYAYSLNLYWNFSGASDLAIGASRFFGVKIAENFDLPYARPNLSEFWRAWHVTLSMWLRDFLFFPIGKRMPRGTAPIVAPLIVMSLCGLWHGLTLPFLAWGFLHGAGLAAHQLWLRARRANATLDAASASIAGRTLGAVLTTHFVALTWVFFAAPSPAVAFANLRSLFSADFRTVETLAWGAVAVAAWSFAPAIRDALRAKAAEASTSIAHHLATLWRTHVDVICVFILVARFLLGRLQPEGAFVYQGF